MVANVTDWSPEQIEALQIARDLVDMGVPIFNAKPNHGSTGGEFILPSAWQTYRPNQRQVDMWRPGDALCMVTGVVFDVLDVDPRNKGREAIDAIATELDWNGAGGPEVYGQAATPSQGEHLLIGRTMRAKTSKPGGLKGVDLQAGDAKGQGRGFVYIAPTVRRSKYGPDEGKDVAYRWVQRPFLGSPESMDTDEGLKRLVVWLDAARPPRVKVAREKVDAASIARADSDTDGFDEAADWTPDEASRLIRDQCRLVAEAKAGEINSTLGGAARVLGRFLAGGWLSEDDAVGLLTEALAAGGVHSDAWNVANRKDWTAATVIAAGLANGAEEPWTVEAGTVASHGLDVPEALPASPTEIQGKPAAPALEILSAAASAYDLQGMLGRGPLSGFFLRDGQVVHTPLVDDAGYVSPRADADDNGPVQIQAVSAGQLAAKIQFAYRCYKIVKGKDGNPDTEVPALYPLQAAQRAIDAPEAMTGLRGLAGVTLTPMVRSDGSILERPGYDPVSRYLFLPAPGVSVRPVPERPGREDVDRAVGLLDEMLDGFAGTWETKGDRANYLGLLLTPLLRLVTPPPYKLFGIGAHQPGSGKTLLADIMTALHGSVFRSEVPEDEPEWRKQITSILATTSAPVVYIDNVTGVLKSSTLAGTLTASTPVTDRELGSTRMVTTVNDRVWLVTGNNLSLGGDLVRRTIIITIDPNMPNPETRTDFKIKDLTGWVNEHRNELLWALLVMIRAWVAEGMPMTARPQSDSFARWESAVAGILAVAGIEGSFDQESGKRAAGGGEDDGLLTMLGHLWDRFADREWTVAEALDGTESADLGDWVAGSRDWLPDRVLGMLARSEAAGRKSLGRYLMYSIGRWVSDETGSLVVRKAPGGGRVARWKLEKH
jgi:bifunctional DNA primase/polymerase-like protein